MGYKDVGRLSLTLDNIFSSAPAPYCWRRLGKCGGGEQDEEQDEEQGGSEEEGHWRRGGEGGDEEIWAEEIWAEGDLSRGARCPSSSRI